MTVPSQSHTPRRALLAMALLIGIGVSWWGVDRLGWLDRSLPTTEPHVEPDDPATVTPSDANALSAQRGESGPPAELSAEVRGISSEERRPAPGPDTPESLASAERRPSRAQNRAEGITPPNAMDIDLEDVANLTEAGRRAKANGRLEEAAEYFEIALARQEETLGPDDPSVARTLTELGGVYASQQRDAEAEAAYLRAIAINEGPHASPSISAAAAYSDLALLYRRQGREEEALPLLESALDVELDVWGPQHPNVAARLSALGLLYRQEGRYDEAEPFLERALFIGEQVYQIDDPQTTGAMTSLALLYREQGRYAEAEDLLQRVVTIHEGMDDQPRVALDLANLSVLYLSNSQFAEAKPVFERALRIEAANQWSDTPQVSVGLDQLARTAQAEGREEEAEEIYAWALDASERVLGSESANTAFLRNKYVVYLRSLGRFDEADRLEEG